MSQKRALRLKADPGRGSTSLNSDSLTVSRESQFESGAAPAWHWFWSRPSVLGLDVDASKASKYGSKQMLAVVQSVLALRDKIFQIPKIIFELSFFFVSISAFPEKTDLG